MTDVKIKYKNKPSKKVVDTKHLADLVKSLHDRVTDLEIKVNKLIYGDAA